METKQEKYELVITADAIVSSDERFTMDDLNFGDHYKPLESYFKKTTGDVIKRELNKGERKRSNQTLPRLAFQMYAENILNLTEEERRDFPVCQYSLSGEIIRGIYPSIEEFKKVRNTIEFIVYRVAEEKQFVIYGWNLFSTIIFVQECLKRFGEEGEQFVLIYREKVKKEEAVTEQEVELEEIVQEFKGYLNPYSEKLLESKNIIFRGAPGTGKSYLAKEIAADIVSNGYLDDYTLLTDEQKQQIEFVQFHPSYDYSDFVEGLRPKVNPDGTMGFELQEGIFTRFVEKALKSPVIFNEIKKQEQLKPFVFIIDEINRGEISKIFGELFFAIDPGYRGIAGEVSTQYANLHEDPNKKFYIPDNIYIIGTMNDIDRSVDSFDFAMRRRFRFLEIKADESLEMLANLGDELKEQAILRMTNLNEAISNVDELNENYHIGASYFLKLKDLDFDALWSDYLQPLLQDYIRGMYDEASIMQSFEKAYTKVGAVVADD